MSLYEQTLHKFRENLELYSERILKIKTAEGDKWFSFNHSQKIIHSLLEKQLKEKRMVRAVILKGRQQGCSTYVGARFYHHVATNFDKRAYVMAHDAKTTNALFNMTLRFYKNTDPIFKPSASQYSQNKLVFDKYDCEYSIGTAGSGEVGRGLTLNYVHGSEVAFWPDGERIAKGLLGAVPFGKETEIILESTANGMNNFFHSQWREANHEKSDYIAIFLPWYIHEENSRELDKDFELTKEEQELKEIYKINDQQIFWRRMKISSLCSEGENGEFSFKQEYPFTAAEAFQTSTVDSLISDNLIIKARKNKVEEDNSPIFLGVDPARYGSDETAMIFRKGKKAFGLKSYRNKDNMEVTGIIAKTLDNYSQIKRVFIDLGGGQGIVDRLKELGYADRVTGVNFGEKALNHEKYSNKRAEMWCEMKKWLQTEKVQIPDDDELHADISVQSYSYQSDRKIQLTKKEILKKKLKRSPDKGDALALTFSRYFDLYEMI